LARSAGGQSTVGPLTSASKSFVSSARCLRRHRRRLAGVIDFTVCATRGNVWTSDRAAACRGLRRRRSPRCADGKIPRGGANASSPRVLAEASPAAHISEPLVIVVGYDRQWSQADLLSAEAATMPRDELLTRGERGEAYRPFEDRSHTELRLQPTSASRARATMCVGRWWKPLSHIRCVFTDTASSSASCYCVTCASRRSDRSAFTLTPLPFAAFEVTRPAEYQAGDQRRF